MGDWITHRAGHTTYEASSVHQQTDGAGEQWGPNFEVGDTDLPSAQTLTPGAPLSRACAPWLSALVDPLVPQPLHPRVVTTLNTPLPLKKLPCPVSFLTQSVN